MVNPTFDTGVFIILLALALYILTTSSKIGATYLLIATTMFIILGLALVTGNDVTFQNVTSDGNTTITQTSYFITNTQQNQSVQYLGYILLVLGFITAAKFLINLNSKSDPLL